MRHGGDLAEAAARYGVPEYAWLDLSTGISPLAHPFQPPSADAWQKLPQSDRLETLLKAARAAYGARSDAPMIAASGTQCLIQLLPLARPTARVAVVGPTYNEHAACWRRSGAEVEIVHDLDRASGADAIVLVNPNNPDGRAWEREHVLACAGSQAARGGVLIVDEAFADVLPEISVAPQGGADGLVILRSFGKFFGLAGVRLGFALGPRTVIDALGALIGPWAVSGPALEIGIQALDDRAWQDTARRTLHGLARRLDALLVESGLTVLGGTSLYRLASHPAATAIHARLAAQGIWVRRYDSAPDQLRFGLPASDADFNRLGAALGPAAGHA
ncbi:MULTISPECIES: threonine-phosphate decarboxylase CobD [Rhodomicrobium]|uniref:threonine-phosphate decarboxylase CobD n=1 Tax=Rhodomicrobium TaxID=1068 RepID=UPI000B4BDE12|nr:MULTISPECIES: threonine-phosphate decarboxylase CobD [Rhodomicrobium]